MQAFLARPQRRYKDSFLEGLNEYIREERTVSWRPDILARRFDEYLKVLRQAETEPLAGMVPASHFWLISLDQRYLGDVDVRHHLNESLRRFGGHIGYKIRPSERRKGYGTLICRLGIEQARRRRIGDILITCDDDNIASWKIIEANGGVLKDKIDNKRGVLTRRYWVYAKRQT